MSNIKRLDGKHTSIDLFLGELGLDADLEKQLREIAAHPGCDENYPIKVMPDAHQGKGCCVGSVIPFNEVIVPSLIGDDIGCGMTAIKTNVKVDKIIDKVHEIRLDIEFRIPMGRSDRGGPQDIGKWGSTHRIPDNVAYVWDTAFSQEWTSFVSKYQKLKGAPCETHLGTLGTGNHFIELTKDGNDFIWILIHSGSRGVGSKVASVFHDIAKKSCNQYKLNRFIDTNAVPFLTLGTTEFRDYLAAQKFCLKYADASRNLMKETVIDVLSKYTDEDIKELETISISHNFIEKLPGAGRVFVTRKGAIRLHKDQRAIIPGAMGRVTYIVSGTGHSDSYSSCSHGAGRIISRSYAKHNVSLETHKNDLKLIECDKTAAVLDETPSAYKDIHNVISIQKDEGMLTIDEILEPILCCKGIEQDFNK